MIVKFDIQCVPIAVKGAAKAFLIAAAHYGGDRANIGDHFEELVSVGAGAVVYVGTQLIPVFGRTDLVGVIRGAGATAELLLCPSHLPEGEEGEKNE